MDFSKAYDCLKHDLLLAKLQVKKYNIVFKLSNESHTKN